MDEAFLLRMNDFDRFLDTQLRRMLDPVVASRPPVMGWRRKASEPVVLAVEPLEAAPAVVVETVPVAVVATPLTSR